MPYRVAYRRPETHDTWTLDLEQTGEEELASFAPGQFAMLYAFGIGEIPVSVSGDLTTGGGNTHTIRAVGAVSSALCSCEPGEAIGLRGPYGKPWPLERAQGRDLVIVAGGVGLAPLRPVVYDTLARRERYGAVSVLYGGRSPSELLYAAELERWHGPLDGALDVRVTVDSAGGGWRGRVGVVQQLVPAARFDADEAVAFVVGPEVMMRFTVAALLERGVSTDRIWVSLERNMKCAVAHCGRCQLGPAFVCRDGPVFRFDEIEPFIEVRRL